MEVPGSFWDQRRIASWKSGRASSYRERLAQQHDLDEKLRACSDALQRVLHERPPSETNLLQTLHAIALLTSQTLGIKRISVWMMDAQGKNLSVGSCWRWGSSRPLGSRVPILRGLADLLRGR